MNKIYAVDALNWLYRSFFAITPMSNGKGEATNALFGFIRSLNKLIKEFHPSHLVVVFDGPDNKRKRSALYADYKSHRKPMPAELITQIPRALEFCGKMGIPVLQIEGVEADDTLGSIAKWGQSQSAEVFLCTSDKDMCQLVTDSVFILNTHKENLLIDRDKVIELYGIPSEKMIDFLAIVGDASDNIPGIKGMGPKTASQLLQEFGSLETILANPKCLIGEKKQKAFQEGAEVALLSKQLATIETSVAIPEDLEFYLLKPPHVENLKEFYQEMRFLSLLKDFDSKTTAEIPTNYKMIEREEELQEVVSSLLKKEAVSFDTETTTLYPLKAELVGIGLCSDPSEAWYIPFNSHLEPLKILNILAPLFKHIPLYGHNFKYDLHVLANYGIKVENIEFDTMLASYLLNSDQQRHNLDQVTLEKFGKAKIPITDLIGLGKNQISMKEVPPEKVALYCSEDVDYTCRLRRIFSKELEEEGLISVLREIELPLMPILLKMEREGIYVDVEELQKLSLELKEKILELENKIHQSADAVFNINSPKQLGEVLFQKLQIPCPKKKESTSAEILEALKNEYPICSLILEYRMLEKLRSTYVDSLPGQIYEKTGRIHCTFNQSVAATGRLSCQDPNLQNIPIRSKEGLKIRNAFKPQKPEFSFLAADYSQIELRLLAHFSEDPALIRAFEAGDDIHSVTAASVFNVPLSAVTSEMRSRAKAVNFGIIYGQQAFGLSQGLGISIYEASEFIDSYFRCYKRVKEYIEESKERARVTGRAETIMGRKRTLSDINSKNAHLRNFAERLAVNTPLQGTQADIIKLAMIEIDKQIDPLHSKMILQIHDELLFEAPDVEISSLKEIVKPVMEGVFKLKVPLLVEMKVGKNWGEC